MIKYCFLKACVVLLAVTFLWSCSDNDDPVSEVTYGWGKTMAGNDPEEITWPDFAENYWEYTLDVTQHQDAGLRIAGQFPNIDTRFFNITIYDDDLTKRLGSVEDFNLIPNEGSQNPFDKQGVTGKNHFEVNIVPSGTAASITGGLKNVLEFPATTKRLCILLRIYFNSIEHGTDFGGVDLPEITLFNTKTGEAIGKAARAKSKYYIQADLILGNIPEIKSQPAMVFTLAPNVMYSNGPTGYVTAANRLTKGDNTVLMFRFIPPVPPATLADSRTADVRYWSVCVGEMADTRTLTTLSDNMIRKSDDGYVNFMMIEKTAPDYDAVIAKANKMKINVITWDSEKDGEPFMVFYRQMYIKNGFEYSVQNIPSYPPLNALGLPDTSVGIAPENMAHIALGEHGPSGLRFPIDIVLHDNFNCNIIRIPVEK